MTRNFVFFLAGFLCALSASINSPADCLADEKLWIDGSEAKNLIPEINLPTFAPAIEQLGRAVVNIRTEGKEDANPPHGGAPGFPGGNPFDNGDPFGGGGGGGGGGGNSPFDYFFQFPPGQPHRNFSSLGSGFIIHPDGYLVTNFHVVEKASKIFVSFRDDKKAYRAQLVGGDPKTDIALLKVDYPGGKLAAAPLGDSENLKAGDWVIAIGNPFRLGHTATVGIVSAKGRRIPGGKPYDSFIQTDASINPGNSGGPLFDVKGEVVGVNTAIFSPGRVGISGFNIGIGFAIPINLVKSIISQIKAKGKVTRGWLGVLIQPVSSDVAEAMGLEQAKGALVADVLPNSPAAKSGFKRGDVIIEYDGHEVIENEDLPLMVAETEINRKIDVVVLREGKKHPLKATILELQDQAEEDTESTPGIVPNEPQPEKTQLGLTLQNLTADIARSMGMDSNNGIVVVNVDPDSVAETSGLRRGDIILEVAGKAINTIGEFRLSTKNLKPNQPLLLLVRRNNNTVFLTLKME